MMLSWASLTHYRMACPMTEARTAAISFFDSSILRAMAPSRTDSTDSDRYGWSPRRRISRSSSRPPKSFCGSETGAGSPAGLTTRALLSPEDCRRSTGPAILPHRRLLLPAPQAPPARLLAPPIAPRGRQVRSDPSGAFPFLRACRPCHGGPPFRPQVNSWRM